MTHAHSTPQRTLAQLGSAALLALLLAPLPAAAGGRKGPQASAAVATVCSLDGTDFTVEVRVRDKNTTQPAAAVDAIDISARYQDRDHRGNTSFEFASSSESGLANIPLPLTLIRSYSLCAAGGGILSELADARSLNAEVDVTYGALNDTGDGIVGERTVSNRCSDDPTTEAIEPSGIKLTPADLAAIDAACPAPTP